MEVRSFGFSGIAEPPPLRVTFGTEERIRSLAEPLDGFFTPAVVARYAAHFGDVRVHDLGDELLLQLVCDDLQAASTCEKLWRARDADGGSGGGFLRDKLRNWMHPAAAAAAHAS